MSEADRIDESRLVALNQIPVSCFNCFSRFRTVQSSPRNPAVDERKLISGTNVPRITGQVFTNAYNKRTQNILYK